MAWYKTGTVAVTNASTTVTGTGTNFVSGAQVGDGFLGPNELLYEITAINSATSLTIAPAYGGATASGQSYAIAPTQGLVATLASDVTDLITDYQSVVDNVGAGKFGDGSAASPAIRFTNDQDTGFFRDTANEIAFATAGVKRGEFSSSGIQLLDGQKFIAGTGSDLSIFHNGITSLIEDNGTGGITLRSDIFTVQNAAGNETVAQFVQDGFVKLFHNNSQVFTTTSAGVNITGTITSDGLTVDTDTLHVDATNNRVGVGTNVPRTGLHLYGAGQSNAAISDSGNLGAFLRVSDTGTVGGSGGGVIFGTNQSEADGFAGFAAIKGLLSNGNDRTIGALAFSTRAANADTALTERMRLTSDGALLVGKTSDDNAVTGLVVNGNGFTKIVRSSSTTNVNSVLQLDRLSSDGDIAVFQKDNATVGSIGTSGGYFFINGGNSGGTHSGLRFINNASIRPCDTTGNDLDATLDLGTSSARFEDLHLSGGVLLGGTGGANKLSDYEEGTWTPVYLGLTSNPTCTYDVQAGYYTKVGNLVTCTGRIRTDAVSGGSGTLVLGGLPFNSKNVASNGSSGTLQVGKYSAFKSGEFAPKMGAVQDANNYCTLLYEASDNSAGNCNVSALDNTTNDNDLHFSITYLSP